MSDSVRPHRQQPTRLPRPWDSPGKNTGVGCHFLLQCMKVKSESEVVSDSSDPMDCSPPGSLGFSRQGYWSGVPLPFASSQVTLQKFFVAWIGKVIKLIPEVSPRFGEHCNIVSGQESFTD